MNNKVTIAIATSVSPTTYSKKPTNNKSNGHTTTLKSNPTKWNNSSTSSPLSTLKSITNSTFHKSAFSINLSQPSSINQTIQEFNPYPSPSLITPSTSSPFLYKIGKYPSPPKNKTHNNKNHHSFQKISPSKILIKSSQATSSPLNHPQKNTKPTSSIKMTKNKT
jgi:hypothetical protein